jgi:hypothetical protein
MYIIEVPLFMICLGIDNIINGNKSTYHWGQFRGFTENMLSVLPFAYAIAINKKQLYKV